MRSWSGSVRAIACTSSYDEDREREPVRAAMLADLVDQLLREVRTPVEHAA
jgi:hypothetical protein